MLTTEIAAELINLVTSFPEKRENKSTYILYLGHETNVAEPRFYGLNPHPAGTFCYILYPDPSQT